MYEISHQGLRILVVAKHKMVLPSNTHMSVRVSALGISVSLFERDSMHSLIMYAKLEASLPVSKRDHELARVVEKKLYYQAPCCVLPCHAW
jgi:hypothetical protein